MEALGVVLNPAGATVLGISLLLNAATVVSLINGKLLPHAWVDKLLRQKDQQIDKLESAHATLLSGMDPLAKFLETMNNELSTNKEPD